jgi:hypothetical protein
LEINHARLQSLGLPDEPDFVYRMYLVQQKHIQQLEDRRNNLLATIQAEAVAAITKELRGLLMTTAFREKTPVREQLLSFAGCNTKIQRALDTLRPFQSYVAVDLAVLCEQALVKYQREFKRCYAVIDRVEEELLDVEAVRKIALEKKREQQDQTYRKGQVVMVKVDPFSKAILTPNVKNVPSVFS